MGLPAPDMTENGQTAEPSNTPPANAAVGLKAPETPEAVLKDAPPAGDTQSPPPADTVAGTEATPV